PGRLPDLRGARSQGLAQGSQPPGEPRDPAPGPRPRVPPQARAPAVDHRAQRRPGRRHGGARSAAAGGWRDAGAGGLPHALAAGRAGADPVGHAVAGPPGPAARPARLRGGAPGRRRPPGRHREALAGHGTWAAGRPHLPPHPGRRGAPAAGGLGGGGTGPGRPAAAPGRGRLMLVTRPDDFLQAWRALPAEPWGPATARGAMLMAPDGLSAAAVTRADNRYMDPGRRIDAARL